MGAAEQIIEDLSVTIIQQQPGEVIVKSHQFSTESGSWTAKVLDENRIVLSAEAAQIKVEASQGSGLLPVSLYKQLILGLNSSHWSGILHVDTTHGVKKIYFLNGQIIFAASSIIDDRLGEILYREARITLDQLTFAASQVTKSQRFGQILVSKGVFSNVQLWHALSAQVQQIIRSTFMVDHIYFELEPTTTGPASEITFTQPLENLVNDMFSYGLGFRAFLVKLRFDSEIKLTIDKNFTRPPQLISGTFLGDFLEIIGHKPRVEQVLNASKLIDIYTIAALYQLVNLGLCRIFPDAEEHRVNTASLSPIRNKIEAYTFMLNAVKKAFKEANKSFPSMDLTAFVGSQDHELMQFIYLADDLTLDRECIDGIYNQCTDQPDRMQFFLIRIESIIKFLFQVVGDNLQFAIAKQLRQEYHSVSS